METLPRDAGTKRQIVIRGAGKRKGQDDIGQAESKTEDNRTKKDSEDAKSDFQRMFEQEKIITSW